MRTLSLVSALAVLAVANLQAAPTPINFTGTANVKFNGSSSVQNIVCPAGLIGCGGSYTATVSTLNNSISVNNANLWCVDYQLSVTPNSQFTASVIGLNTSAATFDNGTQVRYGNIFGSSGRNSWTLNLGSNYNDALSRYKLAATLIMQYQNNVGTTSNPVGGTDFSKPYDDQKGNGANPNPASTVALTDRNRAIQAAIWKVMENNDYGTNVPSLTGENISAGVPAGYTDWIQWAEANVSKTNLSNWAVVSGAYTQTNTGKWQLDASDTRIQTFLVEVVPEPKLVALLTLFTASLFGVSIWRKRRIATAEVAS